jgi:hypothetical protein
MIALLAVVLVAQFALIAWLVNEQRKQPVLIAEIVRCSSPDLREMTELVDRLCQRIQAPQVAVAEHAGRQFPTDIPMHVPMDNDEEYWESKEELAERLAGLNGPT